MVLVNLLLVKVLLLVELVLQLVELLVVFKSGFGQSGYKAATVNTERSTQLVERLIVVAQLCVDVAQQHEGVLWQIFHF